MLLCKSRCQFLHYFGVIVPPWLDDAQEEFRWNSEPKHTVHICPHDFEMEECLEKFLEIEEADVHDLDIQVLQINLQLTLELLIFHVLDVVVLKLLAKESIFLHNFDVVD